jgi:hypothetical protein
MTVNSIKDPNGGPAVDLSKHRADHPDLVKRADKAGLALSKRGLDGIRGEAVLLLDHSGSMRPDYKSGLVQMLVERFLAFALQIDVDGKIPVIPFDGKLHLAGNRLTGRRPHVVTMENYRGVVDRDLWKPSEMGSTVMSAPLEYVADMARDLREGWLFVGLIGDGSPNPEDKRKTTQAAIDISPLPLFLKFLAIRPVGYLQDLDDLEVPKVRPVDNIDAKFISDPAGMSDLAFADAMLDELDTWVRTVSR